jgi:hypothetical protein
LPDGLGDGLGSAIGQPVGARAHQKGIAPGKAILFLAA